MNALQLPTVGHKAMYEISDPGNAGVINPVIQNAVCHLVSAAAETRTVAAPIKEGLWLTIAMKTDGGDVVVTFAAAINAAGNTTATFADVKDSMTLVSVSDGSTGFVYKLVCAEGVGGIASALAGGLAPAGGFTASPRGIWVGQTAPQVAGDFNNSTPVITETYVSEVFVPCNMTITGVVVFNGSDVTGNVTVGLADSTGAPIAAAKSASTAGLGTDALQRIPFATPYAAVGPATYHIQVQYSSATARYNTHVLGNHGVTVQTSQTYGTLTSFTPPTAFVTAVGNVAGLY